MDSRLQRALSRPPVPGWLGAAYGNPAWDDFIDSYWDGAGAIALGVHQEAKVCPSERIVLAGYSSGTLAIHLALTEVLDSSDRTHIGAVMLISDPENRGDGAETKSGSAARSADGSYTLAFGHEDTSPIPSDLAGRTISLCKQDDFVCAPGRGGVNRLGGVNQHGNYDSSEIMPLGAWAAEHLH